MIALVTLRDVSINYSRSYQEISNIKILILYNESIHITGGIDCNTEDGMVAAKNEEKSGIKKICQPKKKTKMGTCHKHPDKETSLLCSKRGVYMCESCMECTNPNVHCKFRQSCFIWFQLQERKKNDKEHSLSSHHSDIPAFEPSLH